MERSTWRTAAAYRARPTIRTRRVRSPATRTRRTARGFVASFPRIGLVRSRARASRLGALAFLLVALALLAVTVIRGAGSDDAHELTTATSAPSTTRAATTTVPHPSTTTTSAPPTTTTTIAPVVVTAPPTAAPPATAAAPSLLVTRMAGIGSAQQVIAVATDGYGTSVATLTAYERDANGWRQVFGPWSAYVGRNGVAPAGEKREGDGRTPSGVYGFDFMFG